MKLVAIMPVRNEAWCLSLTLPATLQWADLVICADHCSTDSSRTIMTTPGCFVVQWFDESWNEMQQRQLLLSRARDHGATHVALIDADEIVTASLVPNIRQMVESLPRNHILQLPGYNLRYGICQYHSSGMWGNRWFSFAFVDDPALGWSGDKFHQREPAGVGTRGQLQICRSSHSGGIMHLWGASERRLIAKHRLYKVIERIRWPHKPVSEIEEMYNWATRGRAPHDTPEHWQFEDVPEAWWAGYDLRKLDLLDAPWQEQEANRLIAEHGREYFAGLRV